jgi:hypothetical protein
MGTVELQLNDFGLPAYIELTSFEVVPVVGTSEALYVLQQPAAAYKSTWEKSKLSQAQFKPVDLLGERPPWVLSRIWRELKDMRADGPSVENMPLQDVVQQVIKSLHILILWLNSGLFSVVI